MDINRVSEWDDLWCFVLKIRFFKWLPFALTEKKQCAEGKSSYSSLFWNSISKPLRWRVFGSLNNIWKNIWKIFIEILFQQKTFSFPFFFISWKRLNTAYKITKQRNSLRTSWNFVFISLQRCWILLQILIEFLRLLLKFRKNFININLNSFIDWWKVYNE